MKLYIIKVVLLLLLVACSGKENSSSSLEKEITAIPVKLNIIRYDEDLKQASPSDFFRLKNKYPYLYPKKYTDSFWVNKMKDAIQQELITTVVDSFPNIDSEKQDIENVLKHIKYYFPNIKTPDSLVTVISEVDYKNKIIYTDSLLLLALDNYLGKKHHFYTGIPSYISKEMDNRYISVDISRAFANNITPNISDRTFLSALIFEGKKLYIQNLLIPSVADSLKIGYSPTQWQWAIENEYNTWRYFIEKQLLFSTDKKLLSRFIFPAPFSKFYLEVDHLSSPRIGQFIGWRIVTSFMKNNPITIDSLLNTNPEKLFKLSKYKPKKP